jgi:O-antigen/teichoic acid export membrane protein
MSEATANAHAYLVTFISGPHAFAVLAIGSLLMRPVSLVLSALPDVERPLMSRALAAGERQQAFRIVKEFRTAAGAIWAATLMLAAVLLTWFPQLLLKKDYSLGDVIAVTTISAAVMALRSMRTPASVLLQAAGEFRKLTGPGLWSSVAALTATFVLLLLFGPVAALGGVLIGETVATERTFALTRAWKESHE